MPLLEGSTDPRAADERLLALAGAGRREAALALADSMLATRGQHGALGHGGRGRRAGRIPRRPRALVDRLQSRPGILPTTRARLLLEDGLRLAAVDSARAEARLRQAAAHDGAGDAGERARLRLTRLELARAASVADLAPIAKELDERVDGQRRRSRVRPGSSGRASHASWPPTTRLPPAPLRPISGSSSPPRPRATRSRLPRSPPRCSGRIVEIDARLALRAQGDSRGPGAGSRLGRDRRCRCSRSATRPAPTSPILQGVEPYGYRELEDSLQSLRTGRGDRCRDRRPSAAPAADSLPHPPRRRAAPRRGLEP